MDIALLRGFASGPKLVPVLALASSRGASIWGVSRHPDIDTLRQPPDAALELTEMSALTNEPVYVTTVSPNGAVLGLGLAGAVQLWRIPTRQREPPSLLITLPTGGDAQVASIAVSPDNRFVFVLSRDDTALLFRLSRTSPVRVDGRQKLPTAKVFDATFDRRSRLLVATADGWLHVFNPQ
jgi:WD40 repeat protein